MNRHLALLSSTIGGCLVLALLGIYGWSDLASPTAPETVGRGASGKSIVMLPKTASESAPAIEQAASKVQNVLPVATLLSRQQVGTAWGHEANAECRAFSAWAEEYAVAPASKRNAMEARGGQLVTARRQSVKHLIATDPAAALAAAVPMKIRSLLPDAIVAKLEQRVSGRGDLTVLATVPAPGQKSVSHYRRVASIDGQHYAAHVFGERADQRTTEHDSLHGIAIDGELAILESPLRLLEDAEQPTAGKKVIATPTVQHPAINRVAPVFESGDTVYVGCCQQHLPAQQREWLAASGGSVPASGGPNASAYRTTGNRSILVMVAKLSGGPSMITQSEAQAGIDQIATWAQQASFQQLTFTTRTVTTELTLPMTKAQYQALGETTGPQTLLTDARAAALAASAAYDTNNFDFDIVVYENTFAFSGLGTVGGKKCWIQLGTVGQFETSTTAHELGHNLGLNHAGVWIRPSGSTNPIDPAGNFQDYGSLFDALGLGGYPKGHYSAHYKYLLGWVPSANIHTVTAPTTSNLRIYAHDAGVSLDPARKYGLRVAVANTVGAGRRDYWMDVRTLYTDRPNSQNGVTLQWGDEKGSPQGSCLIDTTPDSNTTQGTLGDFVDAPLGVGSTFTDAACGVTITPIASGGSGADKYVDVQVTTPDADLTSLALSTGTLAPAFSASTSSYAAIVSSSTMNLTVTPTASASSSTIQVRVNGGAFGSVTSGAASSPLAMNPGPNTVDVKVTATGGLWSKTYSVTVSTIPAIAGSGYGAIPDGVGNGSPGAARDITFIVSGRSGTVSNVLVDFTLNPAHTYSSDVKAVLIAPDSTQHVVASFAHLNDNSYLAGPYFFSDLASGTLSAAITATAGGVNVTSGSYRTQNNNETATSLISTFSGKAPNGTWTLRFTDYYNGDTGSVSAANLYVATTTPAAPELAVFNGASTSVVDERTDNTGTHTFPNTNVGSTSSAQTFTLKNTGTADLTGLVITKTGDFTITQPALTTLAPDATTTFTVSFAPTASGTRTGVISIASNDADENPFEINVSGTGVNVISNTAPIFSLWAQRGPTQDWRCLATSADGMKLVAGASSGPIQLSTDGGVTWMDGPVSGAWSSVACSWDGNHLVATTSSALGSSRLLTSADGGQTWTVRDDQHEWSKVAMSANGDVVFALGDGQIFTSLQYGANLALCNDVFTFTSIACNANGSQVIACADNEQLQLSQNSGTDWVAVESARHWSSVACSADGMTLAATDLGSGEGNDGQVYVSTSSGFIWSPTGPGRSWTQVVCSTDGMRMAALANNQIHFSPDGGLNWLLQSANDASWAFVAINATGSQVFAGGVQARLFVGSSDVLDGISVTNAQSFSRSNFVKHISPGTQASEADQTVTFTADPDHPEFFVIQPAISNDGTLTFTPVAEAFGTVTVTVTAHDDGGTENGGVDTSEPQRFLIHLGTNHTPYGISLSGSQSVPIGASNVMVGTLSALDIDIGDTHGFSFAIGSGAEDNGLFAIANGNELVLATEAMYRAEPYRIRVVATDLSEQSYEQTFAISVFVFNHAPTLTLATDRVAVETNVGPVTRPNFVSAVTTGDAWQSLDSISYLISNDNNALFSTQPSIASDGTLTFTPAEDTSGSAIVTVRAQDSGGTANGGQDTSEPRTFTIIVRNNTAPTDITLSTTTIPENNLPGSIIAHITATDSDEGEVFSYVLVAGEGDTDNADFIVKGDALKLKGTADFETRSTFAIRLQVTDELGATYQESIVLTITDNNDPPSFTIPTSNGVVGETWTAHDQNRNWSGVASSADGFKLAAVEYGGNIHTSTDGGLSWAEHEVDAGGGALSLLEAPPLFFGGASWTCIASSADGSHLVAGVDFGLLYTSADSGETWTPRFVEPEGNSQRGWNKVATSADGMTIVAVSYGTIYISDDGGETWSPQFAGDETNWRSVAISSDGQRIIAMPTFGDNLISTDGGATWLGYSPDGFGGGSWQDVAMSADGMKIAVIDRYELVHLSNDGGETWQSVFVDPENGSRLQAITCSADGTKLAVLGRYGSCFTSSDGGQTWALHFPDAGAFQEGSYATDMASSADGERLVAVGEYTPIITSIGNAPIDLAVNVLDGAFTWEGFAKNILPGPPTESAQSVSFLVTTSNEEFFTVPPSISPSGTLAFTPSPTASGTITVTVVAKDDGGTANGGVDMSAPKIFTITLFANLAPTDIVVDDVGPIRENLTTYEFAGGLHAVDPDHAEGINGDVFTFELVPGEGDADNASFAITAEWFGSQLYFLASADFETQSSYHYRLRVTDPRGASFEKAFTLLIADVNEAPVFTLPPGTFTGPSGVVWTPRPNSDLHRWQDIASSADGLKLAAVAGGSSSADYVYTSSDGGETWSQRGEARGWNSIASSADGTHLAAVAGDYQTGDRIYISADSGQTWTAREAVREWSCVAMSADGSRLVAGAINGQIYTSADYGETWTPRATNRVWIDVTSSADGSMLAATTYTQTGGHIYVSLDYGATWTETGGDYYWSEIACSADGTKLVAAAFNDVIFTSVDSGTTWTPRPAVTSPNSVASSADGTLLTASASGQIFTSGDAGLTWAPQQTLGTASFSIAMSADGSRRAAIVSSNYIHTSGVTAIPEVIAPAINAPFTVAGFATNILPAPVGESTQTVHFIVNTSESSLFSIAPHISNSGTLSFTPAPGVSGGALVTVYGQDDGGQELGGIDTSLPQYFYITLEPTPDLGVQQTLGVDLVDGTSTLGFSAVGVGASKAVTLTITNTGTDTLTNLVIGTSGTNASEFTVTNFAAGSLVPGASTTFDLVFAPATNAPKSAALHIASNVVGSKNPFDVNLTGEGIPLILADWRANYFAANPAGNVNNLEDFDADGVNNLLEFAFGTNPNNNGSGPFSLGFSGTLGSGGTLDLCGQPITKFEAIPTGIDFRAMFIRRTDYVAAKLIYTPQFSGDLITWQTSNATPTVLANDGQCQVVTVPYLRTVAGKKARFFRITVSIAP